MEPGSEFNLELSKLNKVDDSIFTPFNAYSPVWFDYGRSAINAITGERKIR